MEQEIIMNKLMRTDVKVLQAGIGPNDVDSCRRVDVGSV